MKKNKINFIILQMQHLVFKVSVNFTTRAKWYFLVIPILLLHKYLLPMMMVRKKISKQLNQKLTCFVKFKKKSFKVYYKSKMLTINRDKIMKMINLFKKKKLKNQLTIKNLRTLKLKKYKLMDWLKWIMKFGSNIKIIKINVELMIKLLSKMLLMK